MKHVAGGQAARDKSVCKWNSIGERGELGGGSSGGEESCSVRRSASRNRLSARLVLQRSCWRRDQTGPELAGSR